LLNAVVRKSIYLTSVFHPDIDVVSNGLSCLVGFDGVCGTGPSRQCRNHHHLFYLTQQRQNSEYGQKGNYEHTSNSNALHAN